MLSPPIHVEQNPIQDLTQSHWDAIVIGAGPAGTVAAAYLAKKGHQTLLLDRGIFPRSKVCGDGLNHDSQRFLSKINLLEAVRSAGHEVETACVYSTNGIKLVVPGPYLSLERRVFDTILAQRAVGAGATFCRGNVRKLSFGDNKIHQIRVQACERHLQPRYVILATGASIRLARTFNRFDHGFPSAMAVRCYVKSKEHMDAFVGSYVRSVLPGYGWVFPMGDGLFNMGVIAYYPKGRKPRVALKKRFQRFVEDFPLARKVMGTGRMVSELRAAPLHCGLSHRIVPGKGNLIATGETIGTTFNFTGEGIGKAMETGELAARVIHKALTGRDRNVVGLFSAELDKKFRPKYRGYATAERWLGQPVVNAFMARRGVRSKYLQDAVMRVITEEADPVKVFSLKGLVRSFWS